MRVLAALLVAGLLVGLLVHHSPVRVVHRPVVDSPAGTDRPLSNPWRTV